MRKGDECRRLALRDGRHFDGEQLQAGNRKTGLHRPRLSAIIMSSRLPALILIAAPFLSRLSRHTGPRDDASVSRKYSIARSFALRMLLRSRD